MNWKDDEPDVIEFDYNTRLYSPITEEGVKACSSDPSFTCSTGGDSFKCNQKSGTTSFIQPRETFGDIDLASSTCNPTDPTGNCNVENNNQLFVKFDLVKATTQDSKPACMAITSPDVLYQEDGVEYDSCGLTFDFTDHPEEYSYAKWVDLKCNQKTRALMCTTIGNWQQTCFYHFQKI